MNRDTKLSSGRSIRELRHQQALAKRRAQLTAWEIERNDLMENGKTLREALTIIQHDVRQLIQSKPQIKQELTSVWNSFIRNQHSSDS